MTVLETFVIVGLVVVGLACTLIALGFALHAVRRHVVPHLLSRGGLQFVAVTACTFLGLIGMLFLFEYGVGSQLVGAILAGSSAIGLSILAAGRR